MSKSILMSIQPYWGFLIIAKARGWDIEKYGLHEKTVEVRKSEPKDLDWDKTVELYFSKDKKSLALIPEEYRKEVEALCGKVVAKFTCNRIYKTIMFDAQANMYLWGNDFVRQETCLCASEMNNYGKGKSVYGWNISDLKVYDIPKTLYEFTTPCPEISDLDNQEICKYCYETDYGEHAQVHTPNGVYFCEGRWCEKAYESYKEENYAITRPPQSWQYVKEI